MSACQIRPQRSRESGNAILEGALVLMPLLLFILFIIEVGLAMFLRVTMQHAVREGARYAITYQTDTTDPVTHQGQNQDQSIKNVVIRNSLNLLDSTTITVKYYDGQITTAQPVPSLNEIFPPNGNSPGNVVEITARYTHRWATTIISNTPLLIQVASADRMEAAPVGQPIPAR
jgi:Flp pilus assembly protein TadG